jgi:serine/threonine protein kinase
VFEFSDIDEEDAALHEIENEASVYTNLKHKYLCKMIEYNNNALLKKNDGTEISCAYLVMSLFVGGQMEDYIRARGRFSDDTARYYLQ